VRGRPFEEDIVKAIIPAAGIGTRLRPHTHTLPKALLHVAGKPILGHILDQLAGLDVDEVVIVVGMLGEKIEAYVKKNYTMRATFVEQTERLGLGHSIYVALEATQPAPAIIVYGDTIFEGDIARGIDRSVDGSLGVKEVDDPRRFGTVELDGSRVTRLVEKPERPRSNLVIVGVNFINNIELLHACLRKVVKGNVRTRGEYQLTDAFQLMVDEGATLTTFPVEGWFDCGKPETLLATNRHLLEKLDYGGAVEGSLVRAPVFISTSAQIQNSILGPYVSVAERAVIRNSIVEDAIIGEDAQVTDCLLKGSLVGDNALVQGDFTQLNVGDSSEIRFSTVRKLHNSQGAE
jgi:glucose-1-phosphate thymidylyltransferase